ncbi:MAG: TetR/AcrR family transcriptional regulator [Candidatus Aminicenantes bacterium]|nr:TetR/AcrR family transcriptional regulator [Candidatus Aminicenantes bacterium]
MHRSKKTAKVRILEAALKEFASSGYGGGRVDRIARKADVNKAMLFYYFTSKENLFKVVLTWILSELIKQVQTVFRDSQVPEDLIEALPRTYIEFFKKNPDILKMITLELVQNPKHISALVSEIFSSVAVPPRELVYSKFLKWQEERLFSEEDPLQSMMNIVSLSIFSILGVPVVEAIFDLNIDRGGDFFERRIQSIIQLLKKGMLP